MSGNAEAEEAHSGEEGRRAKGEDSKCRSERLPLSDTHTSEVLEWQRAARAAPYRGLDMLQCKWVVGGSRSGPRCVLERQQTGA